MDKTIKTVLAIVGALTAICAVLLILKKKFGCKCCCKKDEGCKCDKPDTVEEFVEEAVEEAKEKVEEVKDAVADAVDSAAEKAEAIAEEFKDYADVELPNE